MVADGRRHALVLATSATGSYSGCRQYREDLARGAGGARTGPAGAASLPSCGTTSTIPASSPPTPTRCAPRWPSLPAELRDEARLVFTAHSIPVSMNATAGPDGGLYLAQQRETARLVAEAVRGPGADFDLVWQSRSGPPQVPWLEPDINDHLRALAAAGVRGGAWWRRPASSPTTSRCCGTWTTRPARPRRSWGWRSSGRRTAGTDPAFVAGLVDLVEEQLAGRPPAYLGELGVCGWQCPAGCCPAPARRGSRAG